jgi:hypothetical protein
MRVVTKYDASFGRPGTWIPNDRCDGIRARFKLGEVEHVIDFQIRWRGPDEDGRVFASPLTSDMSTWITEASTFGGQLDTIVVLQLGQCPSWVASVMRTW